MKPGSLDDFERELIQCLDDVAKRVTVWTRSRDDAREIVQEAVSQALSHRDDYVLGSNMQAWLNSIAYNCYRSFRRDRTVSQHRETFDDEAMNAYPQPASQDVRYMFSQVSDFIETLPRDQKQVIYLVVFDEMSYQDVARTLGCSEGTVKSRLFRARNAVAEVFRDREFTATAARTM